MTMTRQFVVSGPDGYWIGVADNGWLRFAPGRGGTNGQQKIVLCDIDYEDGVGVVRPVGVTWDDLAPVCRQAGHLMNARTEFGRRLFVLISEAGMAEEAESGRRRFKAQLDLLLRSRVEEPGAPRCLICRGDTTCPAGAYDYIRPGMEEDKLYSLNTDIPGYVCTHFKRRSGYWQLRMVDRFGWCLEIVGAAQRRRVFAHYGVEAMWCGQSKYAVYVVRSRQNERGLWGAG